MKHPVPYGPFSHLHIDTEERYAPEEKKWDWKDNKEKRGKKRKFVLSTLCSFENFVSSPNFAPPKHVA